MTGLRLMPRLGCENDAGGQFTNDPGRDSQRHGSRFRCGCCGYTWFCTVGGDALGSPTGRGATPQSEGLVRARGRVCFHTLGPRPPGVAPGPGIPCGKANATAVLAALANEVALRASMAVLRAGQESRPMCRGFLVTPAWSLALHSSPFAGRNTGRAILPASTFARMISTFISLALPSVPSSATFALLVRNTILAHCDAVGRGRPFHRSRHRRVGGDHLDRQSGRPPRGAPSAYGRSQGSRPVAGACPRRSPVTVSRVLRAQRRRSFSRQKSYRTRNRSSLPTSGAPTSSRCRLLRMLFAVSDTWVLGWKGSR